MHVPTSYDQVLAQLLDLAPLTRPEHPLPSAPSAATLQGLAPLDEGPLLPAAAPPGPSREGASSWDPGIFRPEGPVSRYCGLQFSSSEEPISVTPKPGQGFKKPDCGKWIRTIQSEGVIKKILHNCDTLSCPTCMPGAITQKANDVEQRFEQYEQAKMAETAVLVPGEHRNIKPRHIVFTISPVHTEELITKTIRSAGKWDPEIFYDFIREEHKEALKLSGLIGGFYVYHDARVRHPDTGLTGREAKHLIRMEAMAAGNMEDDDPDWKLYDHIRKQTRPERYYYFSPHFHDVVFGRMIDVREFEELMPGWSYHNKKDVKGVGGLARYLFSHMALFEDRRACGWWGRLSTVTLQKKEIRTVTLPVICEETGKPWIIVESSIIGEVGAEYQETVTEYLGFFAKRHRKPPGRDVDADIRKALRKFPGHGKRPGAPTFIREKGQRAMLKFMDDYELPDGIGHL